MDANYSLSDIVTATGGRDAFTGGNSWVLIILFAMIFGGGGLFGTRGDYGQFASASSQQEILFGQRFSNLDNKIDRIGNGIADATFAISDMWQLYYALKSKYPKDDNITKFQKHVRDNLGLIHRSGLVNRKKLIFACLVAYSYRLGGMVI